MSRLLKLLLLIVLYAAQTGEPHAAERVALVIGNGNYEHATELPNPSNDAEEMASVLSGLGFGVIKGIDLDRGGMESKIREFAQAVRPAKLALFFYAGHGMQVNGRNFLIPVDAELADSTALDFEAVDADQVFRHMGSADRVALAFLDACRNNPLARRFARSLASSRSAAVGEGLAAPSTTGTGLFIAFATAPNDVALDGDGRNSPFTQALLKHLPSPGLEIQQLMTRVKADVWEETGGDQQPWHSSDLRSEVYLLPGQTGDPGREDPMAADFEIARGINTKEAWEAFLDLYGGHTESLYVRLAEATLTKLALGLFPPVEELPPNAPLPKDVPLDVEVLKIVETDPFFANAPPVRLRSYTTTTKWNDGDTSSDSFEILWIRPGVVESRFSGWIKAKGIISTQSHGKYLLAGNNFFGLGSRGTFTFGITDKEPETIVTNGIATRVEQLEGHLFPLELGRRFRHRVHSSGSPPSPYGDLVIDQSCEVTKELPANHFHRDLSGDALLVQCNLTSNFTKNEAKDEYKALYVFLKAAGAFILADPLDPAIARGNLDRHTVITDIQLDY